MKTKRSNQMVTSNDINFVLDEIEKDKRVKILYACEAGSRAWGFESNDSDYDVRFIYLNRPEWYLSISEKPRDVIEHVHKETDLDIVGWDLRKTLRLLKKTNPALMEWLNSDIVYRSEVHFMRQLILSSMEYYSPTPLLYHYLHMARGNIREYLKGDTEVWLKKYLYVVRPLMACNWLEMFTEMPPINFQQLYNTVIDHRLSKRIIFHQQIKDDLDDLVRRKMNGDELSFGPVIPSIQMFIREEVDRLSAIEKNGGKGWPKSNSPKNFDSLNNLLRNTLEYYKNF